jgi:hypothetical protein
VWPDRLILSPDKTPLLVEDKKSGRIDRLNEKNHVTVHRQILLIVEIHGKFVGNIREREIIRRLVSVHENYFDT